MRANNGLAGSFKVVRNGIMHCVNASFDTAAEGFDGVAHNPCSGSDMASATGDVPRALNASDSEAPPPHFDQTSEGILGCERFFYARSVTHERCAPHPRI